MKRKTILFLQLYGGGRMPGGTEVYLRNLLKKLKTENKYNFFVACVNKKGNMYEPYAHVEDSRWSRFLESYTTLKFQSRSRIIAGLLFMWATVCLYITARSIIKKNTVSLVYANGGRLSAIVAYILYKTCRTPYVLHFHGLFGFSNMFSSKNPSFLVRKLQQLTQSYLSHASRIIGNSKDVAGDVRGIPYPADKITTVHCFVDEKLFHALDKLACRKKLHLPRDYFIVVSTNRLEKNKRIHILLKTALSLSNRKIMFLFIGDGELRAEVISAAHSFSHIKYIPSMQPDLLPIYINAADIVWGACSIYYLSLTAVEALSCSTPIVASSTPVSLDRLGDKKVDPATLPASIGYLVSEKDSSLKDLLVRLKNNREELENKQKNCLNFYHRVYGNHNKKKISRLLYNLTT